MSSNSRPISSRDRKAIKELLPAIIPFRFLERGEISILVEAIEKLLFKKGEYVLRHGKKGRKGVYILAKGQIETSGPAGRTRIHLITPGHYFGERVTIFDQPSRFDFTAKSPCICYMIPRTVFLRLLKSSPAFSTSLGNILRDKQGVFSGFEHFSSELTRCLNRGYTDLRALLPYYKALKPALHPGITDERIDTGALYYAVRRLPQNVTRNFAYLLTDDLPTEFRDPDAVFQAVATVSRRRDVWEMLPGKSMVLLRSGMSDLVDFVTCLLVYANESAKIRSRLHNPVSIELIDSFLTENVSETLESCKECRAEFLSGLPFSDEEVEGLLRVWPDDLIARISQILRHREVISLNFRRRVHNYHSLRSELWTHQIADATKELFGCEPADLPDDIGVHIISSNSHSVTNCINPLFLQNTPEILAWARKNNHPFLNDTWRYEEDLIYALGPEYFRECSEQKHTEVSDNDCGIFRLHHTASTGIQVQLIDSMKLEKVKIDPHIQRHDSASRKLIVNIDYAFGEQAEDIIRNLILLFGRNLHSINVMGKAGSLVGSRGDILLADAFIEQSQDQFFPLGEFVDLGAADLKKRIDGRKVHTGPILTVAGTLLQNQMMLRFYHHLWNCIGLEMEGTYYHRQILEAVQLGVIPRSIDLRYMYYVSDLPMNKGQSLSERLTPAEGIPPLYAITREILERILSG